VTVRDDGRGGGSSVSAAGSAPGHGLAGMRERVLSVGGELRTGPRADGPGFEVAATLPAGG
jgi:signal transduction histidine kinase